MKHLFLLVFVASLAACTAGQARWDAKLASWVNHTSDSLVQSWGVPARTYPLQSGGVALEYAWSETTQGIGSTFVVPGAYPIAINNPGPVSTDWCKVTFFTNPAKVIQSWRYEGNDCF